MKLLGSTAVVQSLELIWLWIKTATIGSGKSTSPWPGTETGGRAGRETSGTDRILLIFE
jgi:hypothetical protein